MKRINFILTAVIVALLMPAVAYAADGQLVSGPSGTLTNGWYSSNPTIRVNTVPGCSSGPSGNVNMIILNEEGTHRITLRSHLNGYPRLYRDDDVNGHGTSNEIFSCPSVSTPYTGADPIVFWQGDIKWDGTAPTISMSSPSNNSNSNNASVQVSGLVGDNLSGVWTVTVNGVAASVSGGNYSANIPLSVGLNTLTATVRDYAGNTTSTNPVVVNRVSASASGSTNKQPGGSSGSQSQSNSGEGFTAATADAKTASENTDNAGTPTLVKGVIKGGGIGVATVLAFVIVLLLLDKFRIIEVKAFSKISDKFSKNKPDHKQKKNKKLS